MGSACKALCNLLLTLAFIFTGVFVYARTQLQAPAGPNGTAAPSLAAPTNASASATSQTPPANTSGMVWVNTDTGVYHQPGTRYYGKTKHGKYMLETDAIKAGYHPAGKTLRSNSED
jgi:hypothetical protein